MAEPIEIGDSAKKYIETVKTAYTTLVPEVAKTLTEQSKALGLGNTEKSKILAEMLDSVLNISANIPLQVAQADLANSQVDTDEMIKDKKELLEAQVASEKERKELIIRQKTAYDDNVAYQSVKAEGDTIMGVWAGEGVVDTTAWQHYIKSIEWLATGAKSYKAYTTTTP
jgi:hypothetical protein